MNATVMLPTDILFSGTALKVTADTESGRYTLLPRHIDFIAPLIPGIVEIRPENNNTVLIATDEGVMVKQGENVWISVRNAVTGKKPGTLREAVEDHYRELDEKEQKNRTSIARMERDMARSIYEFEKEK
ncbi:MAG: F0F1 ATP synthase subunit epsilon [Chitinivibrionales bacterium]|nr:F0F1 ATP synthase subunit epsilon [Chitinivibrionales bacterium]